MLNTMNVLEKIFSVCVQSSRYRLRRAVRLVNGSYSFKLPFAIRQNAIRSRRRVTRSRLAVIVRNSLSFSTKIEQPSTLDRRRNVNFSSVHFSHSRNTFRNRRPLFLIVDYIAPINLKS